MLITSKFTSTCKTCKGLVTIGQRVNWERGVSGVTHASAAECQAAAAAVVAAPKPEPVKQNAAPIAAFLLAATQPKTPKGKGLKFPKVTFFGPERNGELKLSLAGAASKNPGAVFVKLNGEYLGSIAADGTVRGALAKRTDVLSLIDTFAADPATHAAAYGKLSGCCSFCLAKLSDDRDGSSVEVGYGPVCAKNYGLPHAPKGKAKTLQALPLAA